MYIENSKSDTRILLELIDIYDCNGKTPRHFNFNKDGTTLYVANQDSDIACDYFPVCCTTLKLASASVSHNNKNNNSNLLLLRDHCPHPSSSDTTAYTLRAPSP